MQGQMHGPMQEGIIAEQQVFMGTKESSLEKAATADGASRFTWLCPTTYGPCALDFKSQMLFKLAMYLPGASSA